MGAVDWLTTFDCVPAAVVWLVCPLTVSFAEPVVLSPDCVPEVPVSPADCVVPAWESLVWVAPESPD